MIDLSGNQNPDYMGIFGFSWQEKVAKSMSDALKGTNVQKKMKSFWGAGGFNVSLVNNLYNEYAALMAQNYAPSGFVSTPDINGKGGTFNSSSLTLAARISSKTNVDSAVVLEFLRALFVLARDGKIPFAKWNPAGYKISTDLRKTFSTEQGFLETAQKAATTGKLVLLVAGIGLSAYLLTQVKSFQRRDENGN